MLELHLKQHPKTHFHFHSCVNYIYAQKMTYLLEYCFFYQRGNF